jgi:hypothetical protein
MTVSLRGGAPRYQKRLPPRLDNHATRHELEAPLANRLLCSALASMAEHRSSTNGFSGDPLVEYAGARYRIVGDLVNGTLFDLRHYAPRFAITEGRLRPSIADGKYTPHAGGPVPSVDAIARVSYVLDAEHGPSCSCRRCRIARGRASAGLLDQAAAEATDG